MATRRQATAPSPSKTDGLPGRAGKLRFDVGVGKTQAAIAAMAQRRAEGAREYPVVVVPNTMIPTRTGEGDAH